MYLPDRRLKQFAPADRALTQEVGHMQAIEYKTMAYADDVARMVKQLNELGAQGWEVCAQTSASTGSDVIGRVSLRRERKVLLLKRRTQA
jgi:hypothetical protein